VKREFAIIRSRDHGWRVLPVWENADEPPTVGKINETGLIGIFEVTEGPVAEFLTEFIKKGPDFLILMRIIGRFKLSDLSAKDLQRHTLEAISSMLEVAFQAGVVLASSKAEDG
jgi:hypothetical protein